MNSDQTPWAYWGEVPTPELASEGFSKTQIGGGGEQMVFLRPNKSAIRHPVPQMPQSERQDAAAWMAWNVNTCLVRYRHAIVFQKPG